MRLHKKSIILAVLMMFSTFTGCAQGKNNFTNAPDYSTSNADFLTWSFYSLSKNYYTIDGITTTLEGGVKLPSKEDMQTYKDAGFNVIFLNWMFAYDSRSQKFADSDMKILMDTAHELGLKCLVSEQLTYTLSSKNTSLIVSTGADGINTFSSQEEINALFAEKLADIIAHPAFYGFSLKDEPHYTLFPAIGQVMKGIKSVAPDAFVNMNILPMQETGSIVSYYCPNATNMSYVQAYKNYLQLFYENCDPDRIQYDDYPLWIDANEVKSIRPWHLHNAQIVADFCREKGIEFHKVFQTCAYNTRVPVCRKPTADDMYWQMNIGMAMGIKGYTYWTYYPVLNSAGEYYDETATFVKYDGTKNATYYTMQQIHSEMHATAKALANFEYQGARTYLGIPVPGDKSFLAGVRNDEFRFIENALLSESGILLATELKDGDRYGYYFVNATDPVSAVEETVTVTIRDFDCVQIYQRGEVRNEKLEDGKTVLTLGPGQGAFVIPFQS